jgi:hypothetical protein
MIRRVYGYPFPPRCQLKMRTKTVICGECYFSAT